MGDQQRLIAAYGAGKRAFGDGAGLPALLSGAEREAWLRGWRVAQVVDRAHRIARAWRATAEKAGVS